VVAPPPEDVDGDGDAAAGLVVLVLPVAASEGESPCVVCGSGAAGSVVAAPSGTDGVGVPVAVDPLVVGTGWSAVGPWSVDERSVVPAAAERPPMLVPVTGAPVAS
jgi:hypothetical protein